MMSTIHGDSVCKALHAVALPQACLEAIPSRPSGQSAPGQRRTAAHTPSTGRSAHGTEWGLAAAARRNHAEPRPREPRLPKVKSRRGAIDPTPGRFLFATSCWLPSLQPNHLATTSPLFTTPTVPLAPTGRDPPPLTLAPWPRETGPQLGRD